MTTRTRPPAGDGDGGAPRRFECTEDGASKFWEVAVDGASLTTRWGRLGTTGQTKTKTFADASAAAGELQKLVREKTRKGYVEVTASARRADADEGPAAGAVAHRPGAGVRRAGPAPAAASSAPADAAGAPAAAASAPAATMPAPEVAHEATPDPVPGAPRLVWVGEPLTLSIRPRANNLPRVVPIDERDVGLLYLTRLPPEELQKRGWSGVADMLVSRRLGGAFSTWPPQVGEPLDQLPRDFGNYMPPEVLPGSDQGFIIPLSEPIVGRFDVAGAEQRPDGPGSPYQTRSQREAVRAALGGTTKGRLVVHAGLDDGSTLVVAIQSTWREDTWGHQQHVQGGLHVLRVTADGVATIVASAGSLPVRLERIIPRGDDGAWLVGYGDDGVCAVPCAADGSLGEPWRVPFHRALPSSRTIQRWGKAGLVVAGVSGRGLVLLLTDGRHTTRIEGTVASKDFIGGHLPSVAVSPDGAAIVVAQQTVDGLCLARAAVVEEASEGASDPWSADRLLAAERAARAAEPKAPRLPGKPVEPATNAGPPIRHARERVLRQIRVRHLARAIGALYYGEASFFSGDDRVGHFLDHDGCGNHVAVSWDETGLVAIAFNHEAGDGPDPEGTTWKRHFVPPPEALEPLAERAFDRSHRLATETLWISAGPAPRWASRDFFSSDLAPYTMIPEAVFFGGLPQTWLELLSLDEAHARLAIRLADASARGPVRLTARDVKILTRPPAESGGDGRYVQAAVEALAMIGIRWERA